MSERYKIIVNGKVIGTSDQPYVVMGEPVDTGKASLDFKKLNVNIADQVKTYPGLRYTTDFNTFKLIIGNKTFRSTSLKSAKLNDQFEKQRVGVEPFAGGRFITCFSHYGKEQRYMWKNYGDIDHPENNVQLVFRNFTLDFNKYFYTDYVWLNNCSEKLFCNSPDYWNLVKKCTFPNPEPVPDGCTINNCIDEIKIIDVEYLPDENEAFSQDYSGDVTLHFGDGDAKGINVKGYDPTKLGFQKTKKWEIEHETRVLSILRDQEHVDWDYIDLRLKNEIFRNLTIILSPWDEGGMKTDVLEVIHNSTLPQDIKDSITIESSSLERKMNV